eukprot:3723999-Rhodomonas_salina.3
MAGLLCLLRSTRVHQVTCPSCLLAPYALRGTAVAYGGTNRVLGAVLRLGMALAVLCTEVGYDLRCALHEGRVSPTRIFVLRSGMLVPAGKRYECIHPRSPPDSPHLLAANG